MGWGHDLYGFVPSDGVRQWAAAEQRKWWQKGWWRQGWGRNNLGASVLLRPNLQADNLPIPDLMTHG